MSLWSSIEVLPTACLQVLQGVSISEGYTKQQVRQEAHLPVILMSSRDMHGCDCIKAAVGLSVDQINLT